MALYIPTYYQTCLLSSVWLYTRCVQPALCTSDCTVSKRSYIGLVNHLTTWIRCPSFDFRDQLDSILHLRNPSEWKGDPATS